jgi:hypothetical protein
MAAVPPLPTKATVSTWRALPKIAFRALFNTMGVVVAMTTAALIAGVLEVAPRPFSRLTVGICFGIAILGLITIAYHIYQLRRFDMARIWINRLLVEGHQLVGAIGGTLRADRFREFPSSSRPEEREQYNLMADWCRRVENVLRKYLDESYVTRFHLGGSNERDARSMVIWKMNHRLETLATFLQELKP